MNCKPGDLAIQIISEFPENVGCLCEVLEMEEFGVWYCRCLRDGTVFNFETGEVISAPAGEIYLIDDYKLLPIKGLKIKEKEECIV